MCETVFLLGPSVWCSNLEGWYKEKLYFIFLDLCFKLQLCSVPVTEWLNTWIALTKSWLELRFDQRFEGEQGLIAVEHHGGHVITVVFIVGSGS